MAKKINQPELQLETPAAVTDAAPGSPEAVAVDLIDDTPDTVTSDLRKFNRAKAEVAKAIAPLKLILKISDQKGVDSAMEHMKGANKVATLIENKRKALVKPYNDEVSRINAHAKTLSEEVPTQILRVKGLVLDFNTAEALRVLKERHAARHKQLLDMGMVNMENGSELIKVNHYHDVSTDCNIYRADLESVTDVVWMIMVDRISLGRLQEREKAVKKLENDKNAAAFFGEDDQVAQIDKTIEEVKATPPAAAPAYYGGSYAAPKTSGLTKTWTFELQEIEKVPAEFLQLNEVAVRKAIAAGRQVIPGLKIFQKESISLR